MRVDPIALVVDEAFGIVPFLARRDDTAIDYTRRAIELDPSYWQAYTWLGLALAEKGLFPEAIEALETAWKLDNSPMIAEFLCGIYARGDYTDKALEMIEEISRQAEYRFVCPYELATIYIGLNDYDKAFELLIMAYETRSPCIPWLNVDPRLDPIRDDPRFEELHRLTGHK